MKSTDFSLGPWIIRPQAGEAEGTEGIRHVKPRTLLVLIDLANHAGQVRSRDELLDSVWSDMNVGEEVLTHCIWELRKLLGDDPKSPTYIQTVHRRGYRLLAPVSRLEPESGGSSRYAVGDRIGDSAFGVIHSAQDTLLGRRVALKFLPNELSLLAEAKSQFLREARIAASIEHPNIGTLHEIAETADRRLFLVMPLYQGESLKQRLRREAIGAGELAGIGAMIALGLAAAHARQVIHHDIKPSNVFLTDDGQIKIVDFGIAKLVGDTAQTVFHSSQGSGAYRSPEKFSASSVDTATDLWSLGVLLYECLAGRRPFAGADDRALANAVLNSDPEPLDEVCSDVPALLVELIAELLAKDAGRRPSAAEAAQRLQAMASATANIGTENATSGASSPPRGDLDLAVLRDRVARTWIKQALEPALRSGTSVSLYLSERDDLLHPIWAQFRTEPDAADVSSSSELAPAGVARDRVQHANAEPADLSTTAAPVPGPIDDQSDRPRVCATGCELLDLYAQRGRAMLIAGAAGSGKTTTLLRIAEEALERSRADPLEPVPIVLNLASWPERRERLDRWLESEINARYFTTQALGRRWLRNDDLLLLLDGLDEVAEKHIAACVQAINRFRQQRPQAAIIVSARSETVEQLVNQRIRLELEVALEVCPLTVAQTMAALQPKDDAASPLPAVIADIGRTPLVLSLIRRALERNDDVQRFANAEKESIQRQLLVDFVQCNLRRRDLDSPYAERDALAWLSSLARSMLAFDQPGFQIERLQPNWLVRKSSRYVYVLCTRAAIGITLGLLVGVAVSLQRGLIAIPVGVLGGLAAGIGAGIIDLLVMRAPHRPRWGWFARIGHGLLLLVGSAAAIRAAFVVTGGPPPVSMVLVVCIALTAILRRNDRGLSFADDLHPVEALVWSWRAAARRSPIVGLLAALGNLVAASQLAPLNQSNLIPALATGITITIGLLPLCGLTRGISRHKVRPNHGMWLTGRNALIGAALTLASTHAVLFASTLFTRNFYGSRPLLTLVESAPTPALPWSLGLICGSIAALWLGGADLIKHIVLRVLIWAEGTAPLNYSRFLEFATRAAVLRRVGSGYEFVHRSVLELLASWGTGGPQRFSPDEGIPPRAHRNKR